MWGIAGLLAVTVWLAPAPERPYLSCIDGHIVQSYRDCPTKVIKPPPAPPRGGGGRGGLLGLGGLGGIL